MSNKPKSRKNDIVVQNLENETLIYDLRTNQAFCLNQTSGLVWQFCDGTNSIGEIINLISKKLKMSVGEDFVLLALDELNKNNLLEKTDKYFSGIARREMIRRVGLTTVAALPLVIAVSAPKAAEAASVTCTGFCDGVCAPGCVCSGSGFCGGSGVPCPNIGGSCFGVSGTCTIPIGTCSVGGICLPGQNSCSNTGVCISGNCSVGGFCSGTGACTATGGCTFPPGTCSVPDGVCPPGATTCFGSGTCLGTGTCK